MIFGQTNSRLFSFLAIFILLASQWAPQTLAEESEHLIDHILKDGELKVAVSPGFVPFVVDGDEVEEVQKKVVGELEVDTATGVVGFDIELARALAASLNVRLVLVKARNLAHLQQLVDDEQVHMALSGLTRTLERAWSFYISDPYFVSGLIILVPEESPYRTLADLNVSNATVIVKPASTSEAFARKNLPNASIEVINTEAELAKRLSTRDSAAILDAIKARSLTMSGQVKGKFRRLESRRFTDEYFGILMQRDTSLVRYVNLFLEEFKRSGKFHEVASRFNPWFRSED